MTLIWGLLVGLAFGVSAALTHGWPSRLLNLGPVLIWFGWLTVLTAGGLTGPETRALGTGLLGVLLAMFATWAIFPARRRRRAVRARS